MQQISPEDKSLLTKYTQVAKKIIYDPQRMQKFMQMLGTKEGAVTAVNTVVAAVDKLRPVPENLIPLLGVNAYMVMVDVAQEATGAKPDPAILKEVIGMILQATAPAAPAEQPAPAPEQGMLAQMQGGAAPAPQPQPEGGMLANMQRGVPA